MCLVRHVRVNEFETTKYVLYSNYITLSFLIRDSTREVIVVETNIS